MTPTLADLAVPAAEVATDDWNDAGVAVFEGLVPGRLISAYRDEWKRANGFRRVGLDGGGRAVLDAARPGGWPDCTPYMENPALLDLLCSAEVTAAVESVTGEPMGLHLNLTGWVSTERRWHQDAYLNPATTGDRYCAVWIALDQIDACSGPFQYVPGSHRWPQVTRERMAEHFDLGPPSWPADTQGLIGDLFEAEIARRGGEPITHLPGRGDMLVWHPRLLHQGSRPEVRNAFRPALIAHYTATAIAPWERYRQADGGGWFYEIHERVPV